MPTEGTPGVPPVAAHSHVSSAAESAPGSAPGSASASASQYSTAAAPASASAPSSEPHSRSGKDSNVPRTIEYSDKSTGRFERQASQFRNWIRRDGSSEFRPEADRYHLYVAYACPWAHRTLLVRALKGLQHVISVSVVHWFLPTTGWNFADGDGVVPDTVNHKQELRELYYAANPDYKGRFTVPVLWDKKRGTIVNNESSEIIQMLNSEFNDFAKRPELDLYPEELRGTIDPINDRVYHTLNNGVYRCGFASKQEAYDEAVDALFDTLDWLEEHLQHNRYLAGERFTLADIRLWVTLLRFDPVYVAHFKCNKRMIASYPALTGFLREIAQLPGVEETINMAHIKNHYFQSHTSINPRQIVGANNGPDLRAPHMRGSLKGTLYLKKISYDTD